MFDLGGLSDALTTKNSLMIDRQKKEMEVAGKKAQLSAAAVRRSGEVTHESVKSAGQTREQQLQMYSTMDETLRIAQEGMKLSDSQNPLDRLQLWMMQQSDPRYTAEGNTRRLQYLQGASSALSSRELINQQAFQDELLLIQTDLELATLTDDNELAMLTLAETQGQELIDAYTNRTATMAGELQNQNAMQEGALMNLDAEQTRAALSQAANAPDGTVNVGGIQLSKGRLESRVHDLQQRESVVLSHQANIIDMKLNDMTLEQTQVALLEAQNSPDGYVDMGGVKISTARLMDRQMSLQSRDMQVQSQMMAHGEAVRNMTQRNITNYVQTLSLPELEKIATAGGVIEELGGQKIDLSELNRIRTEVATNQTISVNNQVAQETLLNPAASGAKLTSYMDTVEKFLPADSPVRVELERGRTAVRVATKFAGDGADSVPGTPEFEAMVRGEQVIAEQRALLEASIDLEAGRLANGDKNRENAYKYVLRGQQIPETLVVEALTARMKNNQPIGDWLTGPSNATFTAVYHSIVNGVPTAEQMKNMTPEQKAAAQALTMMDKDQKIAYATQQALEATRLQIGGAMSNELMYLQLDPKMGGLNHPLAPHMTPTKLMSMMQTAEQTANQQFHENNNISAEDMATYIKEGSNPELNRLQTAQFLIELDKVKPGLSKSYMDWWASPEQQAFTQRYVEAKTVESASQGFAAASEVALVLPGLKANTQGYATLLQDAQTATVSAQLQKDHMRYITFGGDSRAAQAFLLEADKSLSATVKSQAMEKIFMPLIQTAQAEGRSAQEINQIIEQSLHQMRPEDPATRQLLQTVLKNRDTSLTLLDNFIHANTISRSGVFEMIPPIGMAANWARMGLTDTKVRETVQGYEWLTPR